MSKYLILLRGGEFEGYSESEMKAAVQRYIDWADALRQNDAYHASEALKREGTILTKQGGEIVDGPYAETKEAVGGFYLIEAADDAAALAEAKKSPHLDYGGTVEVRPIQQH